jgi:hypothetical protein
MRPEMMNMHTPSQLKYHEAHKAAQQRLWGKPKPVKPQLVIVARNDRPPVDASYHMVLYRSYQANLRANFSLSGSFEIQQGVDYQPYATEIHFEEGESPPKTMKQIAAEVLTGFPGISLDAVKGKRRLRSIVAARQMVIYEIARQLPGKSYPEIGRFIGKDHTTILHAVQKLRAIHEQDADGIMWLERKNKKGGAHHD